MFSAHHNLRTFQMVKVSLSTTPSSQRSVGGKAVNLNFMYACVSV